MGTFLNYLFSWRKWILSIFLLCFAVSLASAQQKTVTGKITSVTEGALPGVNIVLQGTVTGVLSDAEGNFSIAVPGPEAVLTFSFIGYTSRQVTVGSQTSINVVLDPAMSALTEVVVVGYGTQKKREVTSSITSVTSDDFNKGSVNTPVALIQGKVSGLSISKPGGNLNGGYNIRLRGLSTIGANTGPLVVVDGVIGGSLDNVDPNDIESINVLKDGSAAAIYGSRGSSGVILVQTKRGKKGTAVIDYNTYVSAEMISKHTDVMNATEWRAMSAETGLGTDFGYDTDWFKETTQTGYSQVHNISMSGGAENSTYRASLNYRDASGVMRTSGFKQLNGRINIIQKAINDRLTLDLNLGATNRNASYGFSDAFKYATIFNPTAPVKSDDAAYAKWDGYFNQTLFDYCNPVQILEENKNDGIDEYFNVSLKGTFEIIKGLNVDAFYSRQTTTTSRSVYFDKNSFWLGANTNGMTRKNADFSNSQLFESTVKYNGEVSSAVSLTALGGYSYQDFEYDGFNVAGGNYLTDAFIYNNLSAALDFANGIGTADSYKNSNKLIAFFGRVNVDINQMIFVTASARYEGSSRFGADNKWGLFPAIGAGVDLAKVINVPIIDNLKVRANYGVTGNQPRDSYISLLRLGPSGNFYYNGKFGPAYAPVSNANTDLKWEKKSEIDVGFDFSLLKSKITGAFDFYTRTTTDLLFQYEVPVPPNLFSTAWLNLGEIKSSGLELSVDWNAIQKEDFSYSMSFTPSYNLENTLVSLSGTYNGADLKYGVRDIENMGSPGQNQVPLIRAEEGKPIGQIQAYQFVEIDGSGNLVLEDVNGDGTVDPKDRIIAGNGVPKFLFGFGNNLTYKNIDFNVFFRGVFGHSLINSFRAFYEVPKVMGSYNLPKTATDMRNASTGTLLNNSSGVFNSSHVEKADFVSLDNMSLGYTFNISKSSVFSKIRIYAAGNNLFYVTKYKGVDPNPRYGDDSDNQAYEGSFSANALAPGIDRRAYWSRTRTVSFGANIVF
jgi:TonB-linked SusC/RagA family outer membrane protein